MELTENISLNIKYSMRCAKKFLLCLWWRQAAVSQRLKYASCRGGWGEHSSQRTLRRFMHWP